MKRIISTALFGLAVIIITFLAFSSSDHESAAQKSARLARTVNVLSYNIYSGQMGLDRVASILKQSAADIIALQEVDRFTGRSGNIDQAAYLADKLGMHHRYVAYRDVQGGEWGLAVLSRYAIKEARSVFFAPGQFKGQVVRVMHAFGAIDVYNVHLKFSHPEFSDSTRKISDRIRLEQARTLYRQAGSSKNAVLIMGDFNDVEDSSVHMLMSLKLTDSCKGKMAAYTWNSEYPVVRIDYIFAGRQLKPVDCRSLPVIASDHIPVRAALEWQLKPAEDS